MAGWTRLQNGHWKSENSTKVIGASALPRTGASPIGTFFRGVVRLIRTSYFFERNARKELFNSPALDGEETSVSPAVCFFSASTDRPFSLASRDHNLSSIIRCRRFLLMA